MTNFITRVYKSWKSIEIRGVWLIYKLIWTLDSVKWAKIACKLSKINLKKIFHPVLAKFFIFFWFIDRSVRIVSRWIFRTLAGFLISWRYCKWSNTIKTVNWLKPLRPWRQGIMIGNWRKYACTKSSGNFWITVLL